MGVLCRQFLRGVTRLTLAIALSTVVGCGGKVYEIHQGQTVVEGIPFYTVAANCTQETVYLETVYHLVLQLPEKDKTPALVLGEKSVAQSVYFTAVEELRKAVAETILRSEGKPEPDRPKSGTETEKPQRKIDEKPGILEQFTKLTEHVLKYPPDQKEVTLTSNVRKSGTYVDYSKPHYINVKKPLIGSASATAKLNENGTLAEGAAEVEDKTVETFLSAIPFEEVILGLLPSGSGGTDALSAMGRTGTIPVQLVISPRRYKYTLTKTVKGNECDAATELKLGATDVHWRREVLGEGGEKGDESAYGVTGKITLPKKGGGL